MAEIDMRLLTADDAPLYRSIRLEALRLNPEAYGSTFERENAQPLSWFAERLANGAVLGAFRGADLVGVTGLAFHQGKSAHKGFVWGVYVKPEDRGLGIGRKLMEAIIEIARSKVEVIQIAVVTENEPAYRLYRSLGFEQYGLEEKALKTDGRYYDERLMALDLSTQNNSVEA